MNVRSLAPHGTLAFMLSVVACSSTGALTMHSADTGGASTSATDSSSSTGTGGSAGTGGAADCAAPPAASKCGNESSWVRGVARFDPSHFAPSAAPVLRVSLRHSFTLVAGEEKIGGRLHAYVNVPVKDVASGEVPFAVDMCMFGAAMWSEENGEFHLVAMLDENGNNNLDDATTNKEAVTIATPDVGELVAIADVDVSCHAASPCVDIKLDCTTGPACTTIQPVVSCTPKTPGCPSDDAFCQ